MTSTPQMKHPFPNAAGGLSDPPVTVPGSGPLSVAEADRVYADARDRLAALPHGAVADRALASAELDRLGFDVLLARQAEARGEL